MRLTVATQVFDQAAVAAEYKRLWDRIIFNAQVRGEHIICGETYRVSDAEMIDEFANVFRRGLTSIVYVQADDFKPAITILPCQACELRRFQPARSTPGRPEVHHQHLASII